MRIALDTNIPIYAEGQNSTQRKDEIVDVLDRLRHCNIVVPTQVLGELFHALTRKLRTPLSEAQAIVQEWSRRYETHPADMETFRTALDLATDHNLQFWDALILCTAADARCRLLLTEDLQDGFVFRGVTVANPFLETLHPLLKDALER